MTRWLACLSAAVAAVATLVPAPAPADDKDGWVPLFNGTDLTGWKMVDPPSGQFKSVAPKKNADGKVVEYVGTLKDGKEVTLWKVENGTIIGAGPASHLFSENEYDNFLYRIEAKINDKGNSGQYFRTKFAPGFPPGYEAQINATHGDKVKTGSLYPGGPLGKFRDKITVLDTAPHKADEFFTQEVTANGNKITIVVNGKPTIEFTDEGNTYTKGHFALQGHDPGTVVTFKKIEYKPIAK
jgi:hypothetical protein